MKSIDQQHLSVSVRWVLWSVLLAFSSLTVVEAESSGLFIPLDPTAPQTQAAAEVILPTGTVRQRVVTLNQTLLPPLDALRRDPAAPVPQSATSGALSLNLFDDFTVQASLRALRPRALGAEGYLWLGELEGYEISDVALTVGEHGLTGQVAIPGFVYQIKPLSNGTHRIAEVDLQRQPRPAGARVPDPQSDDITLLDPRNLSDTPQAQTAPPVGNNSAMSYIDLMVVYTAGARVENGGTATIRADIETSVALGNTGLEASGIDARVRLVAMLESDYPGPLDTFLGDDLDNITFSDDPYLNDVHIWRNEYHADLVSLVVPRANMPRSVCGLGWLLLDQDVWPFIDPSFYGFTAVYADCLTNSTMIHEIGHNMGMAHDRANTSPGSGFTEYAYGWQDRDGNFSTVMAYWFNGFCEPFNCSPINRWSSANQTYQGRPLGDADNDTVRAMNLTRQYVEDFRVNPNPVGPTLVTPSIVMYVINRVGTVNAYADVDGNGIVNDADVAFIVNQLGQTFTFGP